MKITIAGVPLSSKELHSQSATIELLRYLLDHQNQSISCKDLPPSSYSKLKNDLTIAAGPYELLGEKTSSYDHRFMKQLLHQTRLILSQNRLCRGLIQRGVDVSRANEVSEGNGVTYLNNVL